MIVPHKTSNARLHRLVFQLRRVAMSVPDWIFYY